jgi:hypothetical protein
MEVAAAHAASQAEAAVGESPGACGAAPDERVRVFEGGDALAEHVVDDADDDDGSDGRECTEEAAW